MNPYLAIPAASAGNQWSKHLSMMVCPHMMKPIEKNFVSRRVQESKTFAVSLRHAGLNARIERLNGTVHDREIVMHGMDKKKTAQDLVDAMLSITISLDRIWL